MRFILAVAAVQSLAAPVAAQTADDVNAVIETVLGDHRKFEMAFDALKAAVADDDAEAVAALVAYPLVVKVGERELIETPEAFLAGYDAIMTDEIITAVDAQTYETLFANDQGIMFGNGQMWMSGVCDDDSCESWEVKIITIQSTAQ